MKHRPLVILPYSWVLLVGIACIRPATAEDHAELPPSRSIDPELYATGFVLADGLALDERGNLFAANYRQAGSIGRITSDGTASIWCTLDEVAPIEGRRPQANGVRLGRFGRLIVADAGGGRLLRISPDGGSAEVLADRFAGSRFTSIKDVALDKALNIYFTDSGDASSAEPAGSVYRFDTSNRLTQLASDLAFPNGIGITPNQKQLCVAESEHHRILIYDLSPDGELENRRVLIDFPSEDEGGVRREGHRPEGLVFDENARLYVAMSTTGVINVVDVTSGELIRHYAAGGDGVTSCHFHGPYLYTAVAAKEAVFRLKLGVKGFDYHKP